jgi:hypothetical protein
MATICLVWKVSLYTEWKRLHSNAWRTRLRNRQVFLPHIKSTDSVLEPCRGEGAFIRAYARCDITNFDWCEIKEGRDFFHPHKKVDWIISDPPFSKIRRFTAHAYTIADNVVWLGMIGHNLSFRRRFNDMDEAGFAIREVIRVKTPPKPWPQSGFQIGVVHFQRGWRGKTTFSELIIPG